MQQTIAKSPTKAISFSTFMELALYHPDWGYYQRENIDIGKRGDFTTAPEISPLFAKCFANQFAELFTYLPKNILEIGAGTGKFAGDVLNSLEDMGMLPERYFIYEISAVLRKKQERYIQSTFPRFLDRIVWLDRLPDHFSGIVFANEVLDAMPVHCFRISETGTQERCVVWENDGYVWRLTSPTAPQLESEVNQLRESFSLPVGYESEINLHLDKFISQLATSLKEGVIFFVDYGYGEREYYHPERSHGTLTCFYQHRRHDNPLLMPGQQDITAHVDFTRVAKCAVENDLDLLGYTSQAAFLLANRLTQMAEQDEKNLSETERFELHHAIKLLTFPTEMGERIKVMALGKMIDLPLIGFTLQDRRRDL